MFLTGDKLKHIYREPKPFIYHFFKSLRVHKDFLNESDQSKWVFSIIMIKILDQLKIMRTFIRFKIDLDIVKSCVNHMWFAWKYGGAAFVSWFSPYINEILPRIDSRDQNDKKENFFCFNWFGFLLFKFANIGLSIFRQWKVFKEFVSLIRHNCQNHKDRIYFNNPYTKSMYTYE